MDQVFDGDSLAALRPVVGACAAAAGLAPVAVGDVVLAVHELAANAVCHGAGRGRVRLWRGAGMVRCEVSDDGPAAGGGGWSSGPGHGLWLVSQLGGQLSVRSGRGGTVVTVVFAYAPPGGVVEGS